MISENIFTITNRLLTDVWTIKCAAGEDLDGKEEHIINKQKGDPCYLTAESLSGLPPVVMWKTELTSYELEYLGKISK